MDGGHLTERMLARERAANVRKQTRITVGDLHQFVKGSVRDWVKANRNAVQEPILLGDESLATLARIEAVDVDKKNRPLEPVRIERVTVHANPLAA